ncbi:hypothetical protein EDD17DRAFT_1559607 [Pisolithus thermaeus]|nr:hypothetical protein EV401DRAFT_2069918 [Pisolithus croceorrhizus]KAI6165073.1 hypothetical protein EDD17DRAFT_1559607 [Pisolithus thermaeus]
MDNIPEGVSYEDTVTLSYDDSVPYEELVSQELPAEPVLGQTALLNRIGTAKVYLISDSVPTRTAKRKRSGLQDDDDIDMDEDTQDLRGNALFLTGTPISHLPTARIFAYATHFDAQPLALEWINDNSCILVFESKSQAQSAHRQLRKLLAEDIDLDGFVTAKPIPITMWPPEERINRSLGKGEGLKGVIRMRWARNDDVKKRGAKKESQFYRKYGPTAGKEGDGPLKKRRGDTEADESRLDAELDEYLGKDRRLSRSPPPSKMRSDYIDEKNGSLVGHAGQNGDLRDRISAKHRRRWDGGSGGRLSPGDRWTHVGEERREPRERGRRDNRPRKTRQDLDDELDAFLNEKD